MGSGSENPIKTVGNWKGNTGKVACICLIFVLLGNMLTFGDRLDVKWVFGLTQYGCFYVWEACSYVYRP